MGYCMKHDAYDGNGHCKWCEGDRPTLPAFLSMDDANALRAENERLKSTVAGLQMELQHSVALQVEARARVAEWQAERSRLESLMVLWTRSDAIRRGCVAELRAALAKGGE